MFDAPCENSCGPYARGRAGPERLCARLPPAARREVSIGFDDMSSKQLLTEGPLHTYI